MERPSSIVQWERAEVYKCAFSILMHFTTAAEAQDYADEVEREIHNFDPEIRRQLMAHFGRQGIKSRVYRRILASAMVVVNWNRVRKFWLIIHVLLYLASTILFAFTKIFRSVLEGNATSLVLAIYVLIAGVTPVFVWLVSILFVCLYRLLTEGLRNALGYVYWLIFSIGVPVYTVLYEDRFASHAPRVEIWFVGCLFVCVFAGGAAAGLHDGERIMDIINSMLVAGLMDVQNVKNKCILAGCYGLANFLLAPVVLAVYNRMINPDDANTGGDTNTARQLRRSNSTASARELRPSMRIARAPRRSNSTAR